VVVICAIIPGGGGVVMVTTSATISASSALVALASTASSASMSTFSVGLVIRIMDVRVVVVLVSCVDIIRRRAVTGVVSFSAAVEAGDGWPLGGRTLVVIGGVDRALAGGGNRDFGRVIVRNNIFN
jgi:hypothetical protein